MLAGLVSMGALVGSCLAGSVAAAMLVAVGGSGLTLLAGVCMVAVGDAVERRRGTITRATPPTINRISGESARSIMALSLRFLNINSLKKCLSTYHHCRRFERQMHET